MRVIRVDGKIFGGNVGGIRCINRCSKSIAMNTSWNWNNSWTQKAEDTFKSGLAARLTMTLINQRMFDENDEDKWITHIGGCFYTTEQTLPAVNPFPHKGHAVQNISWTAAPCSDMGREFSSNLGSLPEGQVRNSSCQRLLRFTISKSWLGLLKIPT